MFIDKKFEDWTIEDALAASKEGCTVICHDGQIVDVEGIKENSR